MSFLVENNKHHVKTGCVLLSFKQVGEHAGGSNTPLTHRQRAFAVTQIEIKNLKNKPSCGKKKTIN